MDIEYEVYEDGELCASCNSKEEVRNYLAQLLIDINHGEVELYRVVHEKINWTEVNCE